jgi:hypothetical protein
VDFSGSNVNIFVGFKVLTAVDMNIASSGL